MEYDVFISHAHEDKDSVARPLTARLRELGVKVWLDEFELKLGDSLRRSVEHGLSQSKFGIVVLSQHFFRKEWTRRELDALLSKEETAQKVILPIWHEITKEEVFKFSPLLADKLAASTEKGIEYVAQQVLSVVKAVEKEEVLLESTVAESADHPEPPVEIEKASDSSQSHAMRYLSNLERQQLFAIWASTIIIVGVTALVYLGVLYLRSGLNMNADVNKKDNENTNTFTPEIMVIPPSDATDIPDFDERVPVNKMNKPVVKGCRVDIEPDIYCEFYNRLGNRILVGVEIEIRTKTTGSNPTILVRRSVYLASESLPDSAAEISGSPFKTSLYRKKLRFPSSGLNIKPENIEVLSLMLKKNMSTTTRKNTAPRILPRTSPSITKPAASNKDNGKAIASPTPIMVTSDELDEEPESTPEMPKHANSH